MFHVKQRGLVWWVYAIVLALIVGAGATAVLTYNGAIARAEKAEANAAQFETAFNVQLTENERLEANRKKRDAIDAARRRNDQVSANKEAKRDEALKQAYNNPDARKWADTPVPRIVIDSVRDDEAAAGQKDGKGNTASGLAPANAAPGLAADDDKWRPFRLRAPKSAAAPSVQ